MLQKNVPLKKYSNYKIGGVASYFFEFKNKDELILALKEFARTQQSGKVLVIGSGTNILFSDEGFLGLVLKDSINFIKRNKNLVTVGSGTLISNLVSFCTQNSLSGFEWAGGLPGTVGGAIRGNAGAFLGEIGDNVYEVESLDIKTFETKVRQGENCGFNYRQSIFKKEARSEVILSAIFIMKNGNGREISNKTQERIDYRIDRHPLDLPNIGSTFKNVPVEKVSPEVLLEFEKNIKPDPFPVLPVAKLILGAGLVGKTIGGAQISTKHPNFIVNIGGAKASDVLELVELMKKEIKKKYNIDLEEEIMYV